MYHNMTVKFRIIKGGGNAVEPTIAKIKREAADTLEERDFDLEADMDEIGNIIITREDVMDNSAGVGKAIRDAVQLALQYGDPSKVIRVFSRIDEDGDNEGTYTLVCKNEDVLLKAGYAAYLKDLESLTKKLRDLPKHIEQFEDLDDSAVLKLDVSGDNFGDHQL